MNIILLSGGSGKRLWPLSNEIRSKQFIQIFQNETGGKESMLQRNYRRIKAIDPQGTVTIATGSEQVAAIRHQLGDDVNICEEPCRRDTFPAIALAAAYLTDVCHVDPQAPVIICPVDPYVEEPYFHMLKNLYERVEQMSANLLLMGISPTYPSEKYGYIIPETQENISEVRTFKEKPTEEIAEQYIAQGALWNGGIFACKLSYLQQCTQKIMRCTGYRELYARYPKLDSISFDHAVAEHEPKIEVMRFSGKWMDLGTWNTLTEAMDQAVVGRGIMNDTCKGVNILNELDVPILAMGLSDVVISASPDGILVTDKEQSAFIKPYVDEIVERPRCGDASWGSFRIIDIDDCSVTMKVTLNRGQRMSYHSHRHRDEVWVVIAGSGETIVDGMREQIHFGDVVTMCAGCRHTVIAKENLQMIEVQLGSDIRVEDKTMYELDE